MPSQNLSSNSATLTPAAMSILGLEQAGFLSTSREHRSSDHRNRAHRQGQERRVLSYYNHFSSRTAVCNEPPPTYTAAAKQARIPCSQRHLDNGNEILPRYTCTVFKEGPMHYRLESCSPFLVLPFQEWRQCYVRVHGTMLCIYKLKTTTVDRAPVYSAGRLLRQYTLQHAEVGTAPDVTHTNLIPTSRLASLIPLIARRRAAEKEPDMFRHERHYSLRVRSELDQFVLSNAAEDQIISWINHISAGIDIAPELDARSIPKQCTMPRRSRRQQARAQTVPDLTDERLVEQQRQLLAQYPSLANAPTATTQPSPDQEQHTLNPVNAQLSVPSRVEIAAVIPDQEQEDIDLSTLAEDSSESLPRSTSLVPAGRSSTSASRANSQTSPSASRSTSAAVARSNFDERGKWAPPHPRSASQQWRYIRRCMPVLLAETPRHSSVMIDGGRYVRPNYKLDSLDEWSLQPPAYAAHGFDVLRSLSIKDVTRSVSLARQSSALSATLSAPPTDAAAATIAVPTPATASIMLTVPSFGPIGAIFAAPTSEDVDIDDQDDDLGSARLARRVDSTAPTTAGEEDDDDADVKSLVLNAATTTGSADSNPGLVGASASLSSSGEEGSSSGSGGEEDISDDDRVLLHEQMAATWGKLMRKEGSGATGGSTRVLARGSPNLTMRAMGKPGAVLGF